MSKTFKYKVGTKVLFKHQDWGRLFGGIKRTIKTGIITNIHPSSESKPYTVVYEEEGTKREIPTFCSEDEMEVCNDKR